MQNRIQLLYHFKNFFTDCTQQSMHLSLTFYMQACLPECKSELNLI